MPTSSVGVISNRRGVTLIELLIVVTLIALVAGISFPSVASGLESLRLRSAAGAIAAFLDTALERADRRQQVVEISISLRDNTIIARAADMGFVRRLDLPVPVRIVSVLPAEPGESGVTRNFLIYPGGAVPRIGIEISIPEGRRRLVSVDPVTGVPAIQSLP